MIRLRQKDHELREQAQIYEEKLTKSQNEVEKLKNESRSSKDKNNYMITTELITLYSNLNNKYRIEAYDSLHLIDQYQNVKEFKLKLLFSVIVVSYISLICVALILNLIFDSYLSAMSNYT